MAVRQVAPVQERIASLVIIMALVFAAPTAASATPSNSKIKAAQTKAEQVRSHLDDLQADLEMRTEDYLAVEEQLDKTRSRIRSTEAELTTARAELDQSEQRLGQRASAIYRTGSSDMVAVFVGATDFRDLVTRIDLMRRIGRSDAGLVSDVKSAKARIESAMTSLQRRRAEQLVLRDSAKEKQRQVEQTIGEQKSYLAKLDADVKKLIAAEEKRQARLAAQRAREAAAKLASSSGSGRAGRAFDASALGGSHPEVVAAARRYVGVTWYVWGGTTPSGFDCSGLVQYCYAKAAGISLPHTSRDQYHAGAYISPDRLDLLMPGDLVFFGRNGDPGLIHHVAIYSGGGMMIHAPQTGEKVSETSLLARIASRGDYVGAVRP